LASIEWHCKRFRTLLGPVHFGSVRKLTWVSLTVEAEERSGLLWSGVRFVGHGCSEEREKKDSC
jgi:hypothetical protein